MKYIDAEKLKTEIERRMNKHWDNLPDADSMEADCTVHENELCELGAYKELEHIEDFLISLQQEQPELPQIGYADIYYQKGLHDGIIKGQIEILKGLEEIEKRKAEPVLVIKEQEQPVVDLEKELCEYFEGWRTNYYSETEELLKNNGCTVDIDDVKEIARYFYELGKNSK
jgi:hypothetical protein